jgi:thioredoxin reductase
MTDKHQYDVIIVGGSYAGLSAGMTLGRALRRVLIIDGGQPCNRQTPHSHNFITQDGQPPERITVLAKAQVAAYDTVEFYEGLATTGVPTEKGFEIGTASGDVFLAKKLVFATGLKDIMPDLPGFAACWGMSMIHCPYCHGYEVRDETTGAWGNGDMGFELAKLVANWTKDLILFTHGKSTLTAEQAEKLAAHNIAIDERVIGRIEQDNGYIRHIVFTDGSTQAIKAMYARPQFVQHCDIPAAVGCALTQQGHIQVDAMQRTTIPGIYACGDNSQMARSVAMSVAAGSMAGASLNKELIDEEF